MNTMACLLGHRLSCAKTFDGKESLCVGLAALRITGTGSALLALRTFAFIRLGGVFGSVGAGLPPVPALLVGSSACSALAFRFTHNITPS